jgi:2-polyprenyl-6-methoxyphenol hydroxylase-like FAD-dependent oxidoreductase
MHNVPDKGIMLNAYNNKTDIIFCFYAENEIPYDYRDINGQREIMLKAFEGQGWRTAELLEEIKQADNFYFDKFCQIKMSAWTKGRVALVGDAAWCASPAAGMGASLAMIGAAALADNLEKFAGDHDLAFNAYSKDLHPYMQEVQTTAESNVKESFVLRTEEAIRNRNMQATGFSK